MWSLRLVLLFLALLVIVVLLLINDTSRAQIKSFFTRSKVNKKALKIEQRHEPVIESTKVYSDAHKDDSSHIKSLKISKNKNIVSAIDELDIDKSSKLNIYKSTEQLSDIEKYKALVDHQFHNLPDSENQKFYRKVQEIGEQDDNQTIAEKVSDFNNYNHNHSKTTSSDHVAEENVSHDNEIDSKQSAVEFHQPDNDIKPVSSAAFISSKEENSQEDSVNSRFTLDRLFNYSGKDGVSRQVAKAKTMVREDREFNLHQAAHVSHLTDESSEQKEVDNSVTKRDVSQKPSKTISSKQNIEHAAKKDFDLNNIPLLDCSDDEEVVLKQSLVIDYHALIRNVELESLHERLSRNTLSDIVYKERLMQIKDWYLTAKESLFNRFSIRFIDEDGQVLADETIFSDSEFHHDKALIKALNYCDLQASLKLCRATKAIDVNTVKTFQFQCQKLSSIFSSQVEYDMSDTQLYQTIQDIDNVKKECDKVFIVQLNAKPDAIFTGKDIKRYALEFGYSYGYKKLFHKFQYDEAAEQLKHKHGFTLLNRYSPGYFQFEQLNEIETKGVCLVTKPVLSSDPHALLKEFVASAMEWKHALNAEIYVPRSNFTHRETHDKVNQDFCYDYFAKELDIYMKSLAKSGVISGSDIAERLFGF